MIRAYNKQYFYIYKITNIINNKIYVGKHRTTKYDDGYFGGGVVLKKAFGKYGKENFKKEIMSFCKNKEDLNEQEKYWIKLLKTTNPKIGYNLTNGGDGGDCISNHPEIAKIKEKGRINNLGARNPMFGKKASEESRQKLRASLLKFYENPENRRMLSKAQKERYKDPKEREKQGLKGKDNHFYGRKHSEETKKAQREIKLGKPSTMKGKKRSEEFVKKGVDARMKKGSYVHSQESKIKIGKSSKIAWALRKQRIKEMTNDLFSIPYNKGVEK